MRERTQRQAERRGEQQGDGDEAEDEAQSERHERADGYDMPAKLARPTGGRARRVRRRPVALTHSPCAR
ncbi:hypothetical protein tb265_28460 [Gemmatimonadetes bacterium T265]|nr:hypothetical protein tb265_28460 [Gemmatimonadetes bacterium T265]